MTREEAIKRLKSDIYKYSDFAENPNENEFWTAFDMAIKALEAPPNDNWEGYSKRLWKSAYESGKADAEAEQTSAIDKIRAEIIEKDRNVKAVRSDSYCFFTVEEVLEVIDKYKVESEVKE